MWRQQSKRGGSTAKIGGSYEEEIVLTSFSERHGYYYDYLYDLIINNIIIIIIIIMINMYVYVCIHMPMHVTFGFSMSTPSHTFLSRPVVRYIRRALCANSLQLVANSCLVVHYAC